MTATKLIDLIEIEENTNEFILLKVTGSREDLIKTGVFNGDEDMFRVNKNKDTRGITFFYKDGKHTSISHGSSTTCISKNFELQRDTLLQTIQEDLGTFLDTNCQAFLPQKKKDLKGKRVAFIVYNGTCVHEGGRFFKHVKGLVEFENYLNEKYVKIKKGEEYTTDNGCKAIPYSATRK